MKKKNSYLPELILILLLFSAAAAGNALSRTKIENRVEEEISLAQQEREEMSLAEMRRLLLGSAD